MNYVYIPPSEAPCSAFGCNKRAMGLCWRCHRPCCDKHFYLVKWAVYMTAPSPDEESAVVQGELVKEDESSLLCAECARGLPDISGKIW